MVIAFVETYNLVDRKSEKSSQCKYTSELHVIDEAISCCLLCRSYEGML